MPQQQHSLSTPQPSGGGWAQNAFQQQPTTGNDRERVTLCFNDDISEVLNIMQQQQEVKPGERQEEEEEEKRGEKEESEMKSGQVLTVFPPHLPLANLRSILLAQAGE